jgi:hypothetical protein
MQQSRQFSCRERHVRYARIGSPRGNTASRSKKAGARHERRLRFSLLFSLDPAALSDRASQPDSSIARPLAAINAPSYPPP